MKKSISADYNYSHYMQSFINIISKNPTLLDSKNGGASRKQLVSLFIDGIQPQPVKNILKNKDLRSINDCYDALSSFILQFDEVKTFNSYWTDLGLSPVSNPVSSHTNIKHNTSVRTYSVHHEGKLAHTSKISDCINCHGPHDIRQCKSICQLCSKSIPQHNYWINPLCKVLKD